MDSLRAPPTVLLHQLQALDRQAAPAPLDLLLQNPALLIRALDVLQGTTGVSDAASAIRLARIEAGWLKGLTSQAALQLALQDAPLDHVLLARHWQLSRRCALAAGALAQAAGTAADTAALTAALLHAGMLAAPSSATLAGGNAWQAGAGEPGPGEPDAGVRLLESWRFDQFSIDALRYGAAPLPQVLDAAPLVRLCWLANACAAADFEPGPLVLDAGRALLELAPSTLESLLAALAEAFAAECAALDLPVLVGGEVSAKQARDLAQGGALQLQELRRQLLTEHLLSRHAGLRADDAGCVRQQVAGVLRESGIEPVFLLMTSDGKGPLRVFASNRTQADPADLSLVCSEGRSALAAAILNHEIAAVSATTPRLTVVDRQVIALLGGHHVLCESVQAGARHAVLLLGLTPAELKHYPALGPLRRFLRRALLGLLGDGGGTMPLAATLYQQRVREAVHEARNPLTIIKNYLHIHGIKQGVEAEEIRLIKSEIERVSAILGSLLDPAAASAFAEIDLNRLIGSLHKVFAAAVCADDNDTKRIQLNLALAPEAPRVLGNDNLLKQILANLVKNAAEAIDTAGAVTLSTRANVFAHGRLYVELGVADNGTGIAPESLPRLFEPGFTTKSGPHRGSGLGIVRRLVDEMQGHLSCQSDARGTVITLLLPQAPQAGQPA